MQFKRYFFYLLFFLPTSLFAQNAFFNEINYLHSDFCVELVVEQSTQLADWSVTSYDASGNALDTTFLNSLPHSSSTPSGYNIIEVDIVMLDVNNGGLALVDNSISDLVIQFISYGGSITAVDGPAAGLVSQDIGTQTNASRSLQLQGVGSVYEDFEWTIPGDSSCGLENNGQTLIGTNTLLPVDLLYFNAQREEDFIDLSWATASEQHNAFFLLERSRDGFVFETMASVPGAIHSTIVLNYNYQDFKAPLEMVYYRLAQIDTDGKITYSDIVFVEAAETENWFHLFPNPVSHFLQIKNHRSINDAEIVIFNLLGSEVFRKTIQDDTGDHIQLDLNALPSGSYLLSIETEQVYYKNMFIKR